MPRPHPCLAPLPAPLGLRFRALLGLGFVPPPGPRPCVHCASIAYALLPSSASLYVATEQIQNRRLGRCHREVPPASPLSRPPCADIRVTPPSLSSRCGGPRALAGKNRAVCIPFSPNALKRPSSWQHPPEMHAFRDQDGNILAPCIHSRVQSGDSGYMARESCRQGPFFASRNPKSRMARRCCQRRPAFLRQQPAVRRNGLCAMRQRHAARGMAERALRPAARAWPACRMRPPPVISLVSAAACAPCHLARVHRRRLIRVALRRPHRVHRAQPSAAPPIAVGVSRLSVSSCCPRAAHADASRPPMRARRRRPIPTPSRPPMRARRHRPSPNPSQPGPGPEPAESRPPVEPSAPTRAPPPAAPHPAARVPLRFS